MKSMKQIIPCQVFEQCECGHSALNWRIAAAVAGLSVLSILGSLAVVGQAAAMDHISSVMQSHPWPGGTLTWTGDLTGSQTFNAVYCKVTAGTLQDIHAPGEPMTSVPKSPFEGPKFPDVPGSTVLHVDLGIQGDGKGGVFEFQAGSFRNKAEVPPDGLSPVKDGERYGLAFHNVATTVWGVGTAAKIVKLNGTLWCNRVQLIHIPGAKGS
jgi:hypothetical protein